MADLSALQLETIRKTEKVARYNSHSWFLTKCIEQKVTPTGMRLKFGVDALPKSEFLRQTVEDAVQAATLQILTTCRDVYAELAQREDEAIHHLMYQIHQTTSYLTFEAFYGLRLSRYVTALHQLTIKKRTKLSILTKNCHKPPSAPPQQPVRKCRRFKRRENDSSTTTNTNTDTISSTVVNLSDVTLTNEQKQLLTLGPKFCPVPQTLNKHQLSEDIREGCRKLRLKELFYDSDGDDETQPPPKFYKPTGFEPPRGRDHTLDMVCNLLEFQTLSHKDNRRPRDNLKTSQRKALSELKDLIKTRKIRITPADKGGAIVVLNVTDYLSEAEKQLNNSSHYTRLDKDPTVDIAKQSNKIINQFHASDHIDDNTKRWAVTDIHEVNTPIFYHQPKIHKHPLNPPGRPIISGLNGPTVKLSHLIDSWLQNLVTTLPSYIKDSTHMLNIIQTWNTLYGPFNKITLVSIDVNSLYTSIPHADISTALKYYLNSQSDSSLPPTNSILQAINHVLTNNCFTFENKFYRQIHGTAMGTPMAPAIANLFMGWLETRILENSPVPISSEFWKRFIDDIFVLWMGTEEDLKTFSDYINSSHPTVKFTIQSSQTKLAFLDILIKYENNLLHTDVFTKPTDAHTFLHYTSSHPLLCKNNIPYSQFLRLRRLCSQEAEFLVRCNELASYFRRRAYPEAIIQKALEKVKKTPRSHTLKQKQKNNSQRVPFIITYNPQNPPLRHFLQQALQHLHTSTRLKHAIPDPPVLGQRNSRSLRSFLMPSSLPPTIGQNNQPGCFNCQKTRCIICTNHLAQTTTFTSTSTTEQFHIRHHMTCETNNIIYLLYCVKCSNTQYVGETKNTLKQRFYLHRSNIKKNTGTLVTKHFNQPNHSLADLRCITIEKLHSLNHSSRLNREKFWIIKLKTLHPSGLNTLS